jgi:transposase
VLVGIEACGYSEWFERMLHDLGHEVWVGEDAELKKL